MIDVDKVVKILKIEKECVSRNCNRKCNECDLAQDKYELIDAYDNALILIDYFQEKVKQQDLLIKKFIQERENKQ